ncbi:MAG TPA: hypothetical protein VFR41_10285, partial [Acidimicrobiia bacterium]|nr:hypothetical protein [Acidimicrobiia bacterium]
ATEGMYTRHEFEITEALRARSEHVLGVEVACPPQHDARARRTITGGYWTSPAFDHDLNPGGPWGGVRITTIGAVHISAARALCVEASVERGRIELHLALDGGADARDARLRAVLLGPGDEVMLEALRVVAIAAGANELVWTLAVEDPPRWWPRVLGAQPLCALDLTVEVDGEVSDTRRWSIAFREVRARRSQFLINGEPMFLKGASYLPARALPGQIDTALVHADVDAALAANLDFLRVHTHIAPNALYDRADEVGLLLWQDFPMEGPFIRSARRQAIPQARAMVERLAHHPSVFLWCAHDAPVGDDTLARLIAGATLPTWGKEVLDRSVANAIERHDPTRPVMPHSGAGDDTHAWFGWHHGELDGLGPAMRAVPRIGRFVSAFGAQSVPGSSAWIDTSRWPELDWDELAEHHGAQVGALTTRVPPRDAKSFDEWREATQAYHAALLQLQIEDLRRCKHSPSGGFAVFALHDPSPAIGFGILDHERTPKRAYDAVRDACRPVLPMIDPRTGSVHVVNDGTAAIRGAVIEAAVDGRIRRWTGDIPIDRAVFVGRVELTGAVDVEVVLMHAALGRVANRYPLIVLEAGR